METRSIQQVKIYKLSLNDMRCNTEQSTIVAVAYTVGALKEFIEKYKVEPYSDEGKPSFECHGDSHTWHKVFKKDSDYEWYNPVNSYEPDADYHGRDVTSEWCTVSQIDGFLNVNPQIADLRVDTRVADRV